MSTVSPGRPQVKRHAWWHRRGTWGWDLALRVWWQPVRVRQEGLIPSSAGDPHGAHGPGHVQSSPLALRVQGRSGGVQGPVSSLSLPSAWLLLPWMPWPATLENHSLLECPASCWPSLNPLRALDWERHPARALGSLTWTGPGLALPLVPAPTATGVGRSERAGRQSGLGGLEAGLGGKHEYLGGEAGTLVGRREAAPLSLPWHVLSQPSRAHLLPEARPHTPSRASTCLAPCRD